MAIRAANAPVSWGITESVEPPAEYPYARVLDEIAKAGYTGTELGPYGFLPTESAALRRELEKRGLALCSAFVAVDLANSAAHETGLAHVERSAKLISAAGAQLLILSDEITPERCAVAGRREEVNKASWSRSEWDAALKAIRQVIAHCRALDLKVGFHHHAGTHVETPEEVDHLFSLVGPDELGLCLDTGHGVYGGADPVRLLGRYQSRVLCVHLKDVDAGRLSEAREQKMDFYAAVRHGVFVPLGRGIVDCSRVIALLEECRFDGWVVVEQDVLSGGRGADAPLANAIAGREFLRKWGI